MRKFSFLSVFAIGILFLASGHFDGPASPLSSAEASSRIYFTLTGTALPLADAGNYLAEFNGSAGDFAFAVGAAGGAIEFIHPEIGVASVTGLTPQGAAKLGKSKGVVHVTRDVSVQWIPGDTDAFAADGDVVEATHVDPTTAVWFWTRQWNMQVIGMPDAWDIEQGDAGVRVAILDTGISPTHQDLVGRYHPTLNASFVSNPIDGAYNNPIDYRYHGTHVAGIISSNNLVTAGVAPHITLVGVKVLGYNGSGSFAGIIAGMMYAADVVEADVINMSLGAYFPKNDQGAGRLVAALTKAVNYANARGSLVVVSAGNNAIDLDHNANYITVPAECGSAFAVSATAPYNQQNFDMLASYSNYGVSAVDVAAPGGDYLTGGSSNDLIISPLAPNTLYYAIGGGTNYYLRAAGTSMAAPHVSGLAALLKSQNPALTPSQLRSRIERSADDLGKPGVDPIYSKGRINAWRALSK